ncbi:MAG: response regulator [Patescibacteria group bacterium]
MPDVSAKTSGPDVLVVEDDRFIRDIFVQKLKSEGFNVTEAVDGRRALELLAAHAPELILLDLLLPDIDGFEILERIKKEPALVKVPVIVLSNLGDQESIARARALGAADYLIKAHYTPEEIVAVIRKVLQRA